MLISMVLSISPAGPAPALVQGHTLGPVLRPHASNLVVTLSVGGHGY